MTKFVPENILIGGYRIAYGIYGAGDPVVLLHGTPSFSHIWRNVVPLLVKAGHKVFLYDLLGYGHSERPQDTSVDTSVSGQVAVLMGLLDFWGLDKTDIVAHDIGGGVAMRTSIFFPERVRSLTVIDTVSFDSWPSKRTRELMAAGLENLISASDRDHRKYFSDWLLSAVHRKDQLETGVLQTYIDMISGTVGQASLFQHQIRHYNHKHTSESVRKDHTGLHSFLNMSLMDARRRNASAFRLRFSQSFASRLHRPSHANVRSTTHRFGKTTKPFA